MDRGRRFMGYAFSWAAEPLEVKSFVLHLDVYRVKNFDTFNDAQEGAPSTRTNL